jgi:predicted regulator of Ras-like GTPase activity (Roadblock/LC7/MglB family)
MASRVEKIQDVLRGLRQASPDIVGSAVVSIDGFVIASVLPSEIDEELVSGMAAAMLGVGERISSELMASKMEQTYVRSEKGYVILNAVGEESVLVVLTTKEAKLGLVFIDLRRRSEELSKLI